MNLIPVFDLGNVLLPFSFDLFFQKLAPNCRHKNAIEDTFWSYHQELHIDRGGDFAAIHPLLVRDFGLRLTPAELRLAYQDIFWSNQAMWALVRQCSRPRFMLSNTSEPHIDWIWKKFPEVFPLFDECIFSYQIGLCKPEPDIFKYVSSMSGWPPECHVLIDDLEQNVVGARSVGWQAILFQGVEDCHQRLVELALLDHNDMNNVK